MSKLNQNLRLFVKLILFFLSLMIFIFSLLSGAGDYGGGLKGILMNSPNSLPWLLLLGLNYLLFKKEILGASLIVALGIFSIFFFDALENLFILFVISLPLILLGGFLIISNFFEKRKS